MDIESIIQKARPTLKPQSTKTYMSNIRKIAGTKEIDNLKFLDDPDAVFSLMSAYKLTMKRNILSSILVLLSAVATEKDTKEALRKIYADKLLELTEEMKVELAKNNKTETQEKNWVSLAELRKITKALIRNSPGSQNTMIAALYSLQPPTRLDFYDMEIVTPKQERIDNKNYLIITNRSKKTFVFNDYKTSRHHGTVMLPVNKELNTVINKFLKLNPERKYLLQGKNGLPLSRNNLGKMITKIFASTGKQVSLNIIRHVYVSEKVDIEKIKEQNEIAASMMHSSDTQLDYAKK
tara:strand:+ start:328 stop:1209 length:882 start_codon:yes stop_codon:yes gene_type:complete